MNGSRVVREVSTCPSLQLGYCRVVFGYYRAVWGSRGYCGVVRGGEDLSQGCHLKCAHQ